MIICKTTVMLLMNSELVNSVEWRKEGDIKNYVPKGIYFTKIIYCPPAIILLSTGIQLQKFE